MRAAGDMARQQLALPLLLLLASWCCRPAEALRFQVLARQTECLTKNVPEDTGRIFIGIAVNPVLEGGPPPSVRVDVKGADGVVIWNMIVSHEREFNVQPRGVGDHKICFQNMKSTAYVDVAYVDLEPKGSDAAEMHHRPGERQAHKELLKPHGHDDVGERSALATDKDVRDIRNALVSLSTRLQVLTAEQWLVQHKYNWQLDHAKKMHRRTTSFALMEVLVLLAVAAAQVFVIRSMFSDGMRGGRRGARVVKGLFNSNAPGLPTARLGRLAV